MKTIKVSDFSKCPGGRFKSDGKYSAQEFREKYLEPIFRDESYTEKIMVDLDGVEGYSTAFLEETFGGLVRLFGEERVLERLNFKCNDEPLIIDEIKKYINMANKL